jgi:NAD(P)-dependent dehydrogenase (short-subunit alcohol dehydrogenase family)
MSDINVIAPGLGGGRTVLITGANSGIGLATARRLAAVEDGTVILHARTAADAEQALEELVKDGIDPLRLKTAVADFTRLDEVRDLAECISREHPRLDVLINNAATIGPARRIVTGDGHELTFQVNYLAPYLLTRLLWEPLSANPRGRVINVSSSLHRSGNLNWGDPNYATGYSPVAAYAQSKLALTMFTKGMGEYGHSGPDALAVHPGIINTSLLRIYGRVGGQVGEAAAVLTHLAAHGSPADNGGYHHGLTPGQTAPLVRNRKAVGRLWKLSARLTGLA